MSASGFFVHSINQFLIMKKALLLFSCGLLFKTYSQTPLFQNSNEHIWAGHSVACTTTGPGTIHDNKFIRVFDTDTFDIQDTAFFLYIEMAVQQTSGGPYDLIGRVYELNGSLLYANMSLIADDTAAVYPDSSIYRMKIPLDEGYALPGDTLVTEVYAPLNDTIIFFAGSNPYLETGPSYLAAPGCGFIEPTTMADLSNPQVKLILKLWVNQKPSLNSISTYVFKDDTLDFTKTEFDAAMADFDSDTISLLQITALPLNGILRMNGFPMNVGDTVLSYQIDSLSYIPNSAYVGLDAFTVRVKDGYHWSNTSGDIQIDVLNWQLGINEVVNSNDLVYPNPVHDFLTVNLQEPPKFFKVIDVFGREIQLKQLDNSRFDVSELPAGTYFFVAESNVGISVNRFVKL